MSIGRKIRLAMVTMTLGVLGQGLVLFWSVRQVELRVNAVETSAQVVRYAFMLRVVMDEYLAYGDKRPLRQWNNYIARLGQILEHKEVFQSIDQTFVKDLEADYREVMALSPQVVQMGALKESSSAPQETRILRETLAGVMSLRLEELVNSAAELKQAGEVLMLERQNLARTLLVVMGIFVVMIVLASLYLIQRSIVQPLQELTKGVDAVGGGNLDYVVETKRSDEVGSLARSFNIMVERLRKSHESLEDEIAGRKRAQEDLVRSNKDLEQFAYVASHDLQEPLRNVASCMQMLDRKYQGEFDAEGAQLIRYAVESVTRMKALINDLLAYSRISTRGSPFQPTDFEEVLAETLANMRPSIEQTGAVITHDPLPSVAADATQVMQVFQNLIGNALKFRGEEPPHIHVSAVRDDGEWVFSIKDNGIGIEPRHWERIFVIFRRLHKRNEYEGTGMGLAIVKKIIERHQGRIWVKSEPGKGTTFHFTIPAKESN